MTPTLLFSNNAETVLAAGISASATSMTVSEGTAANFPVPVAGSSYFKLSITDAATQSSHEIVHVTAVSDDTFTIERGKEGTTALAWSVNDIAANMVTAGSLSLLPQFDTTAFLAATAGRLLNIQVITATGTYKPTAGATKALAIITGAGAGASGCTAVNKNTGIFAGAGGGAGATAMHFFTINAVSYAVTVGLGGKGGLGQVAGESGGQSSLNGAVANGGQPGTAAIDGRSSPGGSGGSATGGIMQIAGGTGSDGQLSDYLICGDGGTSFWGGGGRAGNAAGINGSAWGSGGGGAYDVGFTNTAFKGGDGKEGVIVIYEFQ